MSSTMGKEVNIPAIDATIRVKTQQVIKNDQSSCTTDLPIRHWKVELCMLNEKDEEVLLDIVSTCIFYLHPSFKEPVRKFSQPPFVLEEEGWGEFDIEIVCHFIENVGKFKINHPLTFDHSAMAIDYMVKVPYHTPLIREYLTKDFKLPDIAFDKSQEKMGSPSQIRNWISLIPKLNEDSVSKIVQLILRHPAVQAEVNRQERHEDFLMGLYQLPSDLLHRIGDYVLCENNESEL